MKPPRMQSSLLAVAATVLLLLAVPVGAGALQVPELKGRVNDFADILSASTETEIEALLSDLERTDSTQIVVLTIDSLHGDSLEDFSMRVAEQWRIGQQETDNGAILLIARDDRRVRIEVGYGLEGKLTDLISGRIIRNVITPRFRMGRYDQGVSEAVAMMVRVVRGEYDASQPAGRTAGRRNEGVPLVMAVLALSFFVNVLGRIKRPLGAAAGAVLAPIAGALFFNLGWFGILGLIPLGLIAGFALSALGSPLSFGYHPTRRHGGFHRNGGLGGFSSGGFGGFSGGGGFGGGGFGGGGGGFGGGGASGSW